MTPLHRLLTASALCITTAAALCSQAKPSGQLALTPPRPIRNLPRGTTSRCCITSTLKWPKLCCRRRGTLQPLWPATSRRRRGTPAPCHRPCAPVCQGHLCLHRASRCRCVQPLQLLQHPEVGRHHVARRAVAAAAAPSCVCSRTGPVTGGCVELTAEGCGGGRDICMHCRQVLRDEPRS